MKQVVFFRGRNTAAIVTDAQAAGLCEERTVTVVCREGDALAEPGDVPTGEYVNWGPFANDVNDVILVCNGGTTRQQVPVVLRLVSVADHLRDRGERVALRFVEVQAGGEIVELGEG